MKKVGKNIKKMRAALWKLLLLVLQLSFHPTIPPSHAATYSLCPVYVDGKMDVKPCPTKREKTSEGSLCTQYIDGMIHVIPCRSNNNYRHGLLPVKSTTTTTSTITASRTTTADKKTIEKTIDIWELPDVTMKCGIVLDRVMCLSSKIPSELIPSN